MLSAIEATKNIDFNEKVIRKCELDYTIKLIQTSVFVSANSEIPSFFLSGFFWTALDVFRENVRLDADHYHNGMPRSSTWISARNEYTVSSIPWLQTCSGDSLGTE